jgi:hypothetical protein
MVRRGVPGRGDRLDLGVAEPHGFAVGERVVVELHAGAGRQVRPRAGALHKRRQSRDVIGLHVRLEHRHDRDALGVGQRDVVVDQVDVRIHDRELAVRGAPQQVGGARRLVVEQLPEEHGDLQGRVA